MFCHNITLTGFENPFAVANDIIDKFESLPWSYIITIPLDCALGKKLAGIGKELQISDDISIVTPGEKVWEQFPLTTGNPRKDSTLIPLGLGLIEFLIQGRAKLVWQPKRRF